MLGQVFNHLKRIINTSLGFDLVFCGFEMEELSVLETALNLIFAQKSYYVLQFSPIFKSSRDVRVDFTT